MSFTSIEALLPLLPLALLCLAALFLHRWLYVRNNRLRVRGAAARTSSRHEDRDVDTDDDDDDAKSGRGGQPGAREVADALRRRRHGQREERRDDHNSNDDAAVSHQRLGRLQRKKREKDREDAERRLARAAEEDRRRSRQEAERKKEEDTALAEEERRLAEEAALQELLDEKKRQDDEEYAKWVGAIGVEERGELGDEEQMRQEALIKYLTDCARRLDARQKTQPNQKDPLPESSTEATAATRDEKSAENILVLSDVAREHGVRVELLVKFIEKLLKDGVIGGVFDDRGKFIFVSEAHFREIALFVEQRGRVSVKELVGECNRFCTHRILSFRFVAVPLPKRPRRLASSDTTSSKEEMSADGKGTSNRGGNISVATNKIATKGEIIMKKRPHVSNLTLEEVKDSKYIDPVVANVTKPALSTSKNTKESTPVDRMPLACRANSLTPLYSAQDTAKTSQSADTKPRVSPLQLPLPFVRLRYSVVESSEDGVNNNEGGALFVDSKDGWAESPIRHQKWTLNVASKNEGEDHLANKPFSEIVPAPLNGTNSNLGDNKCNTVTSRPGECHVKRTLVRDTEGNIPMYGILSPDKTDISKVASSPELSQTEMPFSITDERQCMTIHRPFINSGPRDSIDSGTNLRTPSPILVTLLGADRCQRRKHIKMVSCYILGPLLGEGVFGVVRDAIDTSANHVFPPQFHRIAVKSYKFRRSDAPRSSLVGESFENSTSPESPHKNVYRSSITSSRKRHSLKMHRLLDNEVRNLQRFHCPNIIRGIDIFTRSGKDYVVLPIAICNLEQLVKESVRCEIRQRQQEVGKLGSSILSAQRSQRSWLMDKSLPSEILNDISYTSPGTTGEGDPFMNGQSSGMVENTSLIFSAELVRGIMYQLLHGVAYLHDQGLAHNDLKLQNILIYANGELKITDLGSVLEEYNDQGTPMYVSPEVCRYFYCATDADNETKEVKIDALKNDIWSCGVIMYYLLTGRYPWGSSRDTRNKYQLYREIASQVTSIDLSHVLEPREKNMTTDRNVDKNDTNPEDIPPDEISPFSLRHLLSRLLDIDPTTRPTAREAIQHPSLTSPSLRRSSTEAINGAQREVALRVLESRHLQSLIRRDCEKHLQFVAECCSMLNIKLPKEIFIPGTEEDWYENEPFQKTSEPLHENSPLLPKGTVDVRLFPPESEHRYYEIKLGKPENDVRFLLNNPAKVKMMMDYLFCTVLVESGYRSAEEAEAERALELQNNQKMLVAVEHRALQQRTAKPLPGAINRKNAPPVERKNTSKTHCSKCLCGLM